MNPALFFWNGFVARVVLGDYLIRYPVPRREAAWLSGKSRRGHAMVTFAEAVV